VKLRFDLVNSRFIKLALVSNSAAFEFKVGRGPPTLAAVEAANNSSFKMLSISWSCDTVASPNKSGSCADLDPKSTLPDCMIVSLVVSKCIPSTAFKFIVLAELNNRWSALLLKNNLPEFIII